MAGQSITGSSYTNENLKSLQAQLDQTSQQLKAYNTNRATDEELRKRAESEYKPTYNAQVGEQEALKQSAQTALDNQLAALQRQYQRDAETIGQSYDQQRVTANNTMLARGFNNSSLALAMLNRVESQRNKALENLSMERSANETSAQSAYNDAVSAADAAIGRLGADLQTNIDARYQALREAEEARLLQAQEAQNQLAKYQNELSLQLEQLRQQGYSQYLQEQQQAAEKEAQQRAYEQQQREYEFQQKQYADTLAQQQWQNTFNQQQAAASKEQWQKEYDAQLKQQADALAQQAWENAFNEKQAALSQEQWQKEFDFQQQQYADSQKKSSGGTQPQSANTPPQNANTPPSSLEDKYNNAGDQTATGPITSAVSGAISGLKNGLSSVASLLSGVVSKKKISDNAYLYNDGSLRPKGHDS